MELHCLGQLMLIMENVDWAPSEVLQLTLTCMAGNGSTPLCRICFSSILITCASNYTNSLFLYEIKITFMALLYFKS